MNQYKFFYRCKCCGVVFHDISYSTQDNPKYALQNIIKSPPNIVHQCVGDGRRLGVGELIGIQTKPVESDDDTD